MAAAAGLVVGGAATAAVGGGGVAAAEPAPAGCAALDVIAIPGTWETSDHGLPAGNPGMLGAVTHDLPSNMHADYVPYAATAFPWETKAYGASKAEAIANASGMIGDIAERCPATRFAVIGYSQGADAAGDLAARIGHGEGPVPASRVAGVGLISDPSRSALDHLVGPSVIGNGAAGARIGGFGALSDKVRTFCATGDLYCSAPPGDFVTRLAGYLVQQTGTGSSQPDVYKPEGIALLDDARAAGGLPTIGRQFTANGLLNHKNKFTDFLESGIHQDYSTYPVDAQGTSATQWLRTWLIGLA